MIIPSNIRTAAMGATTIALAATGIPQATIDAAWAAFWDEVEGRGARSLVTNTPLDRALSRKQVAQILGRCPKTVSLLVANGKLRGVFGGPGGKRLTGISEASVRKFVGGGAEKATPTVAEVFA